MATHVVWDWNATLFQDATALIDATADAFAAAGLPAVDAERYRAVHTQPIPVFLARLAGRELTAGELGAVATTFRESYGRRLPDVTLTGDALAALGVVADSGRTQSLLSMFPHEQLLPLIRRFDLHRWFVRVDGLVGADSDHKHAHLVRHLDQVGVRAADCVLIGDSVDDARAAGAAGVDCVLYEGGLHARPDLDAEGVPVVGSLVAALRVAGIAA